MAHKLLRTMMGLGISLGIAMAVSYSWANQGPPDTVAREAVIHAGMYPFALKPAPTKHPVWKIAAAETQVSFQIVSNSAGTITGTFAKGSEGWVDISQEKQPQGNFALQLDTLKTHNAKGEGNPARDLNVIEAFFGVRDSSAQGEPVRHVWSKLSHYLQHHVKTAGFEITGMSNLKKNPDGKQGSAEVQGYLYLWNSLRLPAQFFVTIEQQAEKMTIKSTSPFVFNLEQVLGSQVRSLVFETLLAAGCAHQAGIQNQVSVSLDQVVFKKP